MEITADIIEVVTTLETTLREIKQLEVLKDGLSETLKKAIRDGEVDEDTIKSYGVQPGKRSGGLDDSICVLLKEKGLRDAVVTKEIADGKQVREYLSDGRLTKDEVEPYQKPDSTWFGLPRRS